MGIRSILLLYLFQFKSVDGQTLGNSSATSNGVRLFGGHSEYEGMVEVYYNGSWGAICDDDWDINDTEVVCRMLGFSAIGATAVCCSEFGSSVNTSIVLDQVNCTGDEGSIYNCTHSQWFSHDCCHKEYAGVRCGNRSFVGVRLVDGNNSYEGRVEIYYQGSWGTICDDSWDNNDAAVVCRMLGYRTLNAIAVTFYATFSMNAWLPIFLDEVNCSGHESSIYNCSHNPWYSHDCCHTEDAGVRCLDIITTTERTTAGEIGSVGVRLVDGQNTHEGRVEIFYRGFWGTICDDSWDANDAEVVCRMLGYRTLNATTVSFPMFLLNTSLSIFLDEVNCSGHESSIYNCSHNPWHYHDCSHLEDAGARCLDNLDVDFLLIEDHNSGNIYRMDITTSTFERIPLHNQISINDVDYDPSTAVIFWTDGSRINSASILGYGQTDVVALTDDAAAKIYGIAVDSISRLLFYTDAGNDIIAVISLEDHLPQKVIYRDLHHPISIVIDPVHGIIYWINANYEIMKSSYEGTKQNVYTSTSVPQDRSWEKHIQLDLDINAGVLYWCEPENVVIRQVNVNGSLYNYVRPEGINFCNIALYRSYLYVSDYRNFKRIRTNGTDYIDLRPPLYVSPGKMHVHINTSRGINGCSNGRGNCSHLCFPLADGSKMCACPDLMKLQSNNLTCRNSAPNNFLLLTANAPAAIYLLDLSNNNYYKLSIPNLNKPNAITYDHIKEVVYWTDDYQILSASLYEYKESGKVIHELLPNTSLRGISVDALSGLLFYADYTSGIIAAFNLDDSKQKVVINSSLDKPNTIVTDPINGVIYWTSHENVGMIKVANYDGTNQQKIETETYPRGLAIDIQAGILYWCMNSAIKKANVSDLKQKLPVFNDEETMVSRIAIYESYLYYIASNKRNVTRMGTNGSGETTVGPDGKFFDIYLNTIRTESTGTNGCSNKSHGCSHFCFPQPGGSKVCACPDGMHLQSDNHTCGSCPAFTWNTTNAQPVSSREICGSSAELTVLHATVGSLAGLLLIGLLTIFLLIRNNRRMGVKNTDKLPDTNSMGTVDANDDYHTIPTAINTDRRNEPEALCSISANVALYRTHSDKHEGSVSPNTAGENRAIDYIHCF